MTPGIPCLAKRAAIATLAVCALPAGAPAQAFELLQAETGRDGEAYWLRLEARFEAGIPALLAVLTDYDRIHELHPGMLESRSLGAVGPGVEEVQVTMESCVFFLCQAVRRVEQIRLEDQSIFARDVPGRGSFSAGSTAWHFTEEEGGTRLEYETRFVPTVGPVPVFGPGMLLRAVEKMTVELMAEVDRRALRANTDQ